MLNSDLNCRFFSPCDLEIWRTPLPYHFKLCVSFRKHQLIQAWVTVRKRSILVWIVNLSARVTLKNNEAHLLFHSAHYPVAICGFERVLVRGCPNLGKIYFDLCDIDLKFLTLIICMGIIIANSNLVWQKDRRAARRVELAGPTITNPDKKILSMDELYALKRNAFENLTTL